MSEVVPMRMEYMFSHSTYELLLLLLCHLNDSDNKNFGKVPVLEKATSQEFDWEAIKKGAYVTIAGIAGVVVIGWALINNGSGVGVIDDAILLPIGTKLLTMGK